MSAGIKYCPACGSIELEPHCRSRLCDLARCKKCKNYGNTDGARWTKDKPAA